MRYWITLILLFLFNACTSPSFNPKNSSYTESKEQYEFDKKLNKHHRDITSLQNEVDDLLKEKEYLGNGSIIGKIHFQDNNYKSKNLTISKIIKYHGYTLIHSIERLKKFKSTTTYVLFPKNLKKENKNTKKYKRYTKVLELIQEFNNINTDKISTSIKKYTNRFVLTQEKQVKEKKVSVETYNYELATKIIDLFKDKIAPSFFDKEGPFFITVTENIFNKKDFSFLYLDLSTFNDSAITQAINSYKNRLVEKGDRDIDILEGWHYHILSAITNFSDKFHMFNFAYAGGNK